MGDPPALRVSDAEREATVAHLRQAATEGRLTVEELGERVELAYAARTDADLVALGADLPAPGPGTPATITPSGPERDDWVVAIMSGANRKGRWRVRRRTTVLALMGGADLDLREATLAAPEVSITAVAIMGGIDVTVPDGVHVEMTGFALMGGNDDTTRGEAPPPGAPVVRVRAFSLMGGIDVHRRREKRRSRRVGPEPPAPPRLH
jgi:Domain of unknown function (DUF1707)/Cell wall-active antibiotics response 4TMS YvqF